MKIPYLMEKGKGVFGYEKVEPRYFFVDNYVFFTKRKMDCV